jgi:hypothetical protein
MQVMLSAPRPSQVIRLVAQFFSKIISAVVARPLNLDCMMVRSMTASTFGAFGFMPFLAGDKPGLDLAAKFMGFCVEKFDLVVNLLLCPLFGELMVCFVI